MNRNGYAVIGWVVIRAANWFGRRWMRQNRTKVGAFVAVLVVVMAGLAAASGDRE